MISLPWHHRWNVLAFTVLSQALVLGIHSYSFAFWIVPWLEEFKVPRSQLMLIITVSATGVAIVSPFAGIAMDKYSMRGLYCIATSLFAVTLVLISWASSHWMIMFLYGVVLPIGVIFCGPFGSQVLVARVFSVNRGLALGISALGVSLGSFFTPLLVTALLPSYGWRTTFQLLAVATFLGLIPIALIVLRSLPEVAGSHAVGPARPPAAKPPGWTTRSLLGYRDFWIIALCFSALLGAYLPILFSLGSYASDLGITQRRAAFIASMGAVALALGKLSFGKLSDRVEHLHLYQIAAGIILIGISMVSAANSWVWLLFGILLTSFSIGSFVPLLSNIVLDRFGAAAFGKVVGLVYLFTQLSSLFPFIAALIRDSLGSYRLSYMALLVPLIPAMVSMRWLSRRS